MKQGMRVVAAVLASLLSVSAQEPKSPCTADRSAEERMAKVVRGLREPSVLRDAIHAGLRGDGVHRDWMDRMRSDGVRKAYFELAFAWEAGAITRMEVVSEEYLREYDGGDAEMVSAEVLKRIQGDGLATELRQFAVAKAAEGLRKDDLARGGFRKAFGTWYVSLFDDECLPHTDHPAQVCDGDETPLMRRMTRGESNSDLYPVEGEACKDPKDADSEKRDPAELIASGVDVNAKDHSGITALMGAAAQAPEFVRALLEAGAHVSDRNSEGATALWYAARFGHVDAVRLLLANGAEVDARDANGDTPLMEAATSFGEAGRVIRVLYAAGADLNARNNEGGTALMQASRSSRLESVRVLLELGADPGIESKRGETAFTIASSKGESEILGLLKNAKAHPHSK